MSDDTRLIVHSEYRIRCARDLDAWNRVFACSFERYWGKTLVANFWRVTYPSYGMLALAECVAIRQPRSSACTVASESHDMPGTEAWVRVSPPGHRKPVGSLVKSVRVGADEPVVYGGAIPTIQCVAAAKIDKCVSQLRRLWPFVPSAQSVERCK
jgi:hypothetical protein